MEIIHYDNDANIFHYLFGQILYYSRVREPGESTENKRNDFLNA